MNEVEVLLEELGAALDEMDWRRVAELSAQLAAKIRASTGPLPDSLTRALSGLRRKRRFSEMDRVAAALIETGRATPLIKRQHAQSLIERGELLAAETFLRQLIVDPDGKAQEDEARGLLGRTLKQRYISGAGPDANSVLQRAVDAYAEAYFANRRKNYWHGINVVALVERARRDGIPLAKPLVASQIAEEIRKTIADLEAERGDESDPWLTATMMEALIALQKYDEAANRALQYAGFVGADAFEIGSTLRQLEEVWQFKDECEPGSTLLPLLRAALLRKEGSSLSRGVGVITSEINRVSALEKRFGPTGTQTLKWYRLGLECCGSIARIEGRDGHGQGTAWLAQMSVLFPGAAYELVLVTNAHVVRDPKNPHDPKNPTDRSSLAEEVVANFQVLDHQTDLRFLWSSPVDEYDCTVLRMMQKPPPEAKPLTISSTQIRLLKPPQRMYIIGHPDGRDIEFSLQDNHLLDCDKTRLHYRTPTEGGSSGSPVFDQGWRVVGLHHKGGEATEKLDKSGTYQANEALIMSCIVTAAKVIPPD